MNHGAVGASGKGTPLPVPIRCTYNAEFHHPKRAKRMKNTDDWDWADVLESLQEDCEKEHLTDMDLFVAWKIGLAAFLKMRQLGLVTQKEDD